MRQFKNKRSSRASVHICIMYCVNVCGNLYVKPKLEFFHLISLDPPTMEDSPTNTLSLLVLLMSSVWWISDSDTTCGLYISTLLRSLVLILEPKEPALIISLGDNLECEKQ